MIVRIDRKVDVCLASAIVWVEDQLTEGLDGVGVIGPVGRGSASLVPRCGLGPTAPTAAWWGWCCQRFQNLPPGDLSPQDGGATPWPWPRQSLTGQDLRLATPPYGNRGKGLVGFLFCCGFAAKIASSKCFPGKVRRGGRVGGPFLAKQCWPRLVVVLVACKAPNALSLWVRCWLVFGFWFGFWVGCVLSIDSFGQILSGVCVEMTLSGGR